MDLLKHAPRFNPKDAGLFAQKQFGVAGKTTPLPSERDQNFLITTNNGKQFVLKIANAREEVALLEAQNAVLDHLGRRLSFCPQVMPTLSGEQLTKIESPAQLNHYVRLVTYLPGVPLGTLPGHPPSLLRDLGRKLGQMDRELADFDHLAFHRDFHWDIANGSAIVRKYGSLILDSQTQATIYHYMERFEQAVAPLLSKLRRSIIHNDANDYNVIANDAGTVVTGVIDFGDMVHGYTVADLAVAIAYIVLDKSEPLAAIAEVIGGYAHEYPLHDEEIEALYGLMLMRLCMSVCLAASQLQQQPDNDYLKISQRSITNSLPGLLGIDFRKAAQILRRACKTTTKAETIAVRARLLANNL
ncbi:MAG TPA: phosphotransferase, partial [Pyrinomonadaceae bacterium]